MKLLTTTKLLVDIDCFDDDPIPMRSALCVAETEAELLDWLKENLDQLEEGKVELELYSLEKSFEIQVLPRTYEIMQ